MSAQSPRLALILAMLLLGVYVWMSGQPEAAGIVPSPWDKFAHAVWYAVLTGLLLVGLGRGRWPWVLGGMLLLAVVASIQFAGPSAWGGRLVSRCDRHWLGPLALGLGNTSGMGAIARQTMTARIASVNTLF